MGVVETHNLMTKQLKRLSEASNDELEQECDRAKAMTAVMNTIIENNKIILKAQELIGEYSSSKDVEIPALFKCD